MIQWLAIVAGVVAVTWLLWVYRNAAFGRIAFFWFGPHARVGEFRSSYDLRRAGHALSWLAQVAVLFAALMLAIERFSLGEQPIAMLFMFALSLGGGMAVFALIAFGLKAVILRISGRDERFTEEMIAEMENKEPGLKDGH